jgi:hypothetical protein
MNTLYNKAMLFHAAKMVRISLKGITMENICTHKIINDVKLLSPTGNPFGEETGILPVRLFLPNESSKTFDK